MNTDDQSNQTKNQHGLPGNAIAVALEEKKMVGVIPAVIDLSLEEARADTRPDDKTLLELIGRESEQPALDFLKEARSISQAALDAALIRACQSGCKYLVQELVELGADIECQDTSGNTPLLICGENGYFESFFFLVAKKADVKVENYAGDNALILSINFLGHPEITEHFLEQADIKINHQNKDGYTALMKALEVQDMRALTLLLKHYSYLHDECRMLLLDQTVNCKGETAQQIADKFGIGSVFTLLKDSIYKHKSPLLAAVEVRDIEMVSLLFEYGIPTATDITESFNHIFIKRKENANVFTNEEGEIIKKLLENGTADVNIIDTSNETPLMIAAKAGGHGGILQMLLAHGADYAARD